MSKEYRIPSEVKREAEKQARELGVKPDSNHHIVAKWLAKKYNLPFKLITSLENDIALEQEFHNAIHHGGVYFDQATGRTEVIEAFEEDDYIYLAIALLGLSGKDFDERNIHQSRANRSREKKARRSHSRRHRR